MTEIVVQEEKSRGSPFFLFSPLIMYTTARPYTLPRPNRHCGMLSTDMLKSEREKTNEWKGQKEKKGGHIKIATVYHHQVDIYLFLPISPTLSLSSSSSCSQLHVLFRPLNFAVLQSFIYYRFFCKYQLIHLILFKSSTRFQLHEF